MASGQLDVTYFRVAWVDTVKIKVWSLVGMQRRQSHLMPHIAVRLLFGRYLALQYRRPSSITALAGGLPLARLHPVRTRAPVASVETIEAIALDQVPPVLHAAESPPLTFTSRLRTPTGLGHSAMTSAPTGLEGMPKGWYQQLGTHCQAHSSQQPPRGSGCGRRACFCTWRIQHHVQSWGARPAMPRNEGHRGEQRCFTRTHPTFREAWDLPTPSLSRTPSDWSL